MGVGVGVGVAEGGHINGRRILVHTGFPMYWPVPEQRLVL